MSIVRTEYGYMHYENSLQGDESSKFQWNLVLSTIVDEDAGHKAYRVKNRHWELVGPEFKTREEGSRFLGYNGGKGGDVSKNWSQLVAEYNALYSDEIETTENLPPFERKSFGRPSTGRNQRLQFSATFELRTWLESQATNKESLSQVTFRLLNQMMMQGDKQCICVNVPDAGSDGAIIV